MSTAEVPAAFHARLALPAPAPAAAVALGLSIFCWAHLTVSRAPFAGSPASHDVNIYLTPVIALVAAWLAWPWRPSPLLIGGSLIWLAASVMASSRALDPALAWSWTGCLLVALTLLLAGVDRAGLTAGMAIGVAASLPVMLYQAAAQTTWPAAAIQGWAGGELTGAVRGAAVLGPDRWLRPYGFMPHPNIAGGLAAIACVMLASAWLRDRRSWQLALVAAAFAEALLSFSRSAWLGALLGLAALALAHRRDWRPLLLASALPALVFVVAFGGLVVQRASATGGLESDSVSQRIYLARTAVHFWREQPLIGIGPAQFSQQEVQVYGPTFIPEPVHNAVFLVLAETGLAGLAGAGAVALGIASRIRRDRDWGTLAAVLAVLSPLMLDHYLMTFGIGLAVVAAVVGPGHNHLARQAVVGNGTAQIREEQHAFIP